jgi:hypothetical protein
MSSRGVTAGGESPRGGVSGSSLQRSDGDDDDDDGSGGGDDDDDDWADAGQRDRDKGMMRVTSACVECAQDNGTNGSTKRLQGLFL